MAYFNYHAAVKRLIREGKLIGYEFIGSDSVYSLTLFFNDPKHPQMKIKKDRVHEYLKYLGKL